jgi:hypothetical protein
MITSIPIPSMKDSAVKKMTLRFSDGLEFDTSGPFRKRKEHDGWYVAGEGMLLPMASEEEADMYIKERSNELDRSRECDLRSSR